MTPVFGCRRCRDAKWVCERHPLSPYPHGDCDYPGKPCPDCNTPPGDARPEGLPGWQSFIKVEDDDDKA